MLALIQMVGVLLVSAIVGNRFFNEVKNARQRKAPWYAPYRSLPGVIIIAAIVLPIIIWALQRF